MNKKVMIILSTCMIMLTMPVNVLANNNLPKLQSQQLPKLTLPEQKPLTSFDEMAGKLNEKGAEQKLSDSTPVKLPEKVEAPNRTGLTAFDKFKESYGDKWNDPSFQLDKTSKIPDSTFFDVVKAFGKTNQTQLDTVKSEDKAVMSKLLQQKIDKSGQWNLNAIKKNSGFSSSSQQQAFLSSIPKPSGWAANKALSNSAPSKSQWLASAPKAAGYGGGDVWQAVNMIDGIKGNAISSIKNTLNNYNTAKQNTDTYADQIAKVIKSGGTPTAAQKQKAYELEKAETAANPITVGVNFVTNLMKKAGAKVNPDSSITKTYLADQAAESKYGKGNVKYVSILGHNTVVSKNSLVGKMLKGTETPPPQSTYDGKTRKYYTWVKVNGNLKLCETSQKNYINNGGKLPS